MIELLVAAVVTLALVNAGMQVIDAHTTSELIKRGYGKEANPALAKYMNDKNRPWHWRFWFLVAVKLACMVLALLPLLVVRQVTQDWLMVFLVIEAGVCYVYAKQMRLNWALYRRMLDSLK